MKKSLLLLLIFGATITAFAGDVDKAYKFLNSGDYPNALKFLKEVLSDDAQSITGNYGMAKYYSFKDNKEYNLDSANLYVKRASARLPLNPDDKETKRATALGVRDYTIQSLERSINYDAYQIAQTENTLESYQHFIDFYTEGALLEKAINFRNQKAYMRAMSLNNPEAIADFIKTYPSASEVGEARERYEKMLYDQTTAEGTYQSFKKYIDNYPKGKYVEEARKIYEVKLLDYYNFKHTLEAYTEFVTQYKGHPAFPSIEDSIYVMATRHGWVGEYRKFLKNYKDNRNVPQAWQDLYALSTGDGSYESYAAFEKEFPEYPDKTGLQNDKRLSTRLLKPMQRGDKWGFVEQPTPDSLYVAIPFEYEEAYEFNNGLAAVLEKPCGDKCSYFYITKDNKRAFNAEFGYAGNFSNGVAIVGVGDCESADCKYGLIDKRGVYVVPAVYDELYEATEGAYLASKNDKYGFLNAKGETVVSFKYTDALPYSQGVAAAAIDGNWYFIDRTGAQIFISTIMDCSSFSDSLCAATPDKENWGYMDMTGNFVIAPQFESAEDFVNGFAIISKREKDPKNKSLMISQRYKIDKTGKIIEKITAPKVTNSSTSKRKPRK